MNIVITAPDPRLTAVSVAVDPPSLDLFTLAYTMFRVVRLCRALGLAAPQIGANVRVICVRGAVMCNPIITQRGKTMVEREEGCLSLPGVTIMVPRHHVIDVTWVDLGGAVIKLGFTKPGYHWIEVWEGPMSQAKAAAQADYATRILSALIEPAQSEPMRCTECDCANGGADCTWIKMHMDRIDQSGKEVMPDDKPTTYLQHHPVDASPGVTAGAASPDVPALMPATDWQDQPDDMTNRLDELRALEKAVVDGSIQPHDLDAFIPVFGLTSKANDALDAYRDNLEAARRLYLAELPDSTAMIGTDRPRAFIECKYGSFIAISGNPARAWLLAIIRAMIAKEEAKCHALTE